MIAQIIGKGICRDVRLECHENEAGEESWSGSAHAHNRNRGALLEVHVSTVELDGPRTSLEVDGKPIELEPRRLGSRRFHNSDRSIRVDLTESDLPLVFENWAGGLSYMTPLLALLEDQERTIDRVFEFGPGRSTIFFAERLPGAVIRGVEHDARWFEKCRLLEAEYGDRVQISLEELTLKPARNGRYVSRPFLESGGKFDLIFVDGRLRADCVEISRHVLAPGGVVVVHDAHRKNYQDSFERWGDYSIRDNTAFLFGK